MTAPRIVDSKWNDLHAGDAVLVKVGSGSVPRPGTVDRVTPTAVLVTFTWANGRTTSGRRFGTEVTLEEGTRVARNVRALELPERDLGPGPLDVPSWCECQPDTGWTCPGHRECR